MSPNSGIEKWHFEKECRGHFPGGPVVKTSPSNAGGVGSIPGLGANIPHASGQKNKNKIKQKQNCNKFNKDFLKMAHVKKKKNLKINKNGKECGANKDGD